VYGDDVRAIVLELWKDMNYPWAKRMQGGMISRWLPYYEAHANRRLPDDVREKVLSIRASTIEAIVKTHRKFGPRGLSLTRSRRTPLMDSIPVLTDQYKINEPGHLEADLVAHCGSNASGKFFHTLNATDIATEWCSLQILRAKTDDETKRGFKTIEIRLPFDIKGVDTDCGEEFINETVHDLFTKRDDPINQTRSRPYKKNDNAHIEQKNFRNVRTYMGYHRFETDEQFALIDTLYKKYLEPYINFFEPSFKVLRKERIGTKTKRFFDAPKTPCERALEHPSLPESFKVVLWNMQKKLDPYELKKGIDDTLHALYKTVARSA